MVELTLGYESRSFSQRTFEFVASHASSVAYYSDLLGVSRHQDAILGAIANEYEFRYSGPVTNLLQSMADSIASFRGSDQLLLERIDKYQSLPDHKPTITEKIFDVVPIDIGPGNIQIRTAFDLLQWYGTTYGSVDPLNIAGYLASPSALVRDLNDFQSSATAAFATLMIARGAAFLEQNAWNWSALTPEQQNAVLVGYYKAGAGYYQNLATAHRATNPILGYLAWPGPQGQLQLANRTGIELARQVGTASNQIPEPLRPVSERLRELDREDLEEGERMRDDAARPTWDPPPFDPTLYERALADSKLAAVPYPETETFGGAPAKAEDIPRWAHVGRPDPQWAVPHLAAFQQYQQAAQLNCFAKGTLITLADGSSRPIEAIRPGDRVLAFDGRAGRGVPRRVVRLFANTTDEWLVLRPLEPVAGFAALTVTPGHVFLAADGTFRCIDDIVRRDGRIVLADGAAVAVKAERVAYAADTAHRYEAAEAVVYAAVGGAALAPRVRTGWRTYNFEVEDLRRRSGRRRFPGRRTRSRSIQGVGRGRRQWNAPHRDARSSS